MTAATRTAGGLLVAVPLVFTAGFTGLQTTFDYPDILRRPAGEVLTRFAAAGADLHFYWYAMMTAALLMIGAAIATGFVLRKQGAFLAALALGAGVLAGLTQALGLLRWVMLVPGLAAAYVAPGATEIDKAVSAGLFDAANRYLGMGVGEHFGYLFTAAWTLLIAAMIRRASPVMAAGGAVIAAGVISGMLEPFGVPMAGTVNALSYTLWALWTLILGLMLLSGRCALASASAQPA